MISPSAFLFASNALAGEPASLALSPESLRMEACVDRTVQDDAHAAHARLLSAIQDKCEAVTPNDPVCARLDGTVKAHGSVRKGKVCLSTENVDPLTGRPISAPSTVHLEGGSLPKGWFVYNLEGKPILSWIDETDPTAQAAYANQPGAYLCLVTATSLDASCHSLVSANVPPDQNLVISLAFTDGNTVTVNNSSVGRRPGERNDWQLLSTQRLTLQAPPTTSPETSSLEEEAPLSSTQRDPSDSSLSLMIP